MKTKSNFKNFVLYGSQTGETQVEIYSQLLQKIKSVLKHTNFQYFLATPHNLQEIIKKLNEPTYFFPLFLMEGVEYLNFTNEINKSFQFENKINQPLAKFSDFLKIVFQGNVDSIFLMHGSNRYDNVIKHQEIIKFGEALGFNKFCFLEGSKLYKNFIKQELDKQNFIEITPIFFNTGKHIKIDLIDNFLKNYPQSKWQVNSSLLEREDIVNCIVNIATKGLE